MQSNVQILFQSFLFKQNIFIVEGTRMGKFTKVSGLERVTKTKKSFDKYSRVFGVKKKVRCDRRKLHCTMDGTTISMELLANVWAAYFYDTKKKKQNIEKLFCVRFRLQVKPASVAPIQPHIVSNLLTFQSLRTVRRRRQRECHRQPSW